MPVCSYQCLWPIRSSVSRNHRLYLRHDHPKDRHVLAAALACEADYLVTFNLKDFAPAAVRGLPVEVIGPSAFLNHLLALDSPAMRRRLTEQAGAIRIPLALLLEKLENLVPSFVTTFKRGVSF